MRIGNENGNLIYDESNPLCSMTICESQGQRFAFITALDIGIEGRHESNPVQKKYWGKIDFYNKEKSIRDILIDGGKWPELR